MLLTLVDFNALLTEMPLPAGALSLTTPQTSPVTVKTVSSST